MPQTSLRIISARCHRKNGQVEVLIEKTIVHKDFMISDKVSIIQTWLDDFSLAAEGEEFTLTTP